MTSRKILSLLLAAAVLAIAQSTLAVEFGPDSAKITNPYLPLKTGSWSFSKGFGPRWDNKIFFLQAIGTETVSGAVIGTQTLNDVRALKVNIIITDEAGSVDHEFFTFSFAQDTDGNVWVLKIYSHMAEITGLLGGEYFQSMFMPATPAVGMPAGIKIPEDEDNYCRIVQVGIDSLTTTYGTYDNCFKSHCYDEDPTDIEVEYYCYGFGSVRGTTVASPEDFMDLKETGTAADIRAVVVPLGE